jgi:hypothetical protein
MPRTTSNGGRTVVTRGSGDRAVENAPDVCKVPGVPAPQPFPNFALAADLVAGTETVRIAGEPIFTTAGKLLPSKPAHAGVLGGVASGSYCDEVRAVEHSRDVFAEGAPVVRTFDATVHNKANTAGQILPANADGTLGSKPSEADCAALWAQYKAEAEGKIAAAGDDHRLRNHIITGAYADLFTSSGGAFTWPGLAAYASKQVGCAMDYSQTIVGVAPTAGRVIGSAAPVVPLAPQIGQRAAGAAAQQTAGYMYAQLGKGNRELFVDIYPMYRFYQDHGWAKFEACSKANADVSVYALNGFRALANGDGAEHLRQIAYHEQIMLLQPSIYDDWRTRRLLELNEATIPLTNIPLPLTSPAALTFSTGCDPSSGTTTYFRDFGDELWKIPERMDWILRGAASIYGGIQGSDQHLRDLEELSRTGNQVSQSLGNRP